MGWIRRHLRQLRWQLTLSYTAVTVVSLVAIGNDCRRRLLFANPPAGLCIETAGLGGYRHRAITISQSDISYQRIPLTQKYCL